MIGEQPDVRDAWTRDCQTQPSDHATGSRRDRWAHIPRFNAKSRISRAAKRRESSGASVDSAEIDA